MASHSHRKALSIGMVLRDTVFTVYMTQQVYYVFWGYFFSEIYRASSHGSDRSTFPLQYLDICMGMSSKKAWVRYYESFLGGGSAGHLASPIRNLVSRA